MLEDYIKYGFTEGEISDLYHNPLSVIPRGKVPELYKTFSNELWVMAWEESKGVYSIRDEEWLSYRNVLEFLSMEEGASDCEDQASFEEWFLLWGVRLVARGLRGD